MKQTDSNLREIMLTCAKFVEEVYTGNRKGIPQTFYVVKIEDIATFWNWETNEIEYVPDWVVGYWRTAEAADNTYYTYDYRVKNDDWIKVQRKELITYYYEKI